MSESWKFGWLIGCLIWKLLFWTASFNFIFVFIITCFTIGSWKIVEGSIFVVATLELAGLPKIDQKCVQAGRSYKTAILLSKTFYYQLFELQNATRNREFAANAELFSKGTHSFRKHKPNSRKCQTPKIVKLQFFRTL